MRIYLLIGLIFLAGCSARSTSAQLGIKYTTLKPGQTLDYEARCLDSETLKMLMTEVSLCQERCP